MKFESFFRWSSCFWLRTCSFRIISCRSTSLRLTSSVARRSSISDNFSSWISEDTFCNCSVTFCWTSPCFCNYERSKWRCYNVLVGLKSGFCTFKVFHEHVTEETTRPGQPFGDIFVGFWFAIIELILCVRGVLLVIFVILLFRLRGVPLTFRSLIRRRVLRWA